MTLLPHAPSGQKEAITLTSLGQSPAPEICGKCTLRPSCLVPQMPIPAAAFQDLTIREYRTKRGSLLSTQHQATTDLTITKVGQVAMFRDSIDQRQRPVAIVQPGAFFGLASYLGGSCVFTAKSAGPGRICRISLASITKLAKRYPDLKTYLTGKSLQLVSMLSPWMEIMGRTSVSERVLAALLALSSGRAHCSLKLPSHILLADILGTSRESIARALSALEADGTIEKVGPSTFHLDTKRLLAALKSHSPAAIA